MANNNLRDGRVRNWFYLENDLLDRQDLNIYEKTVYIVIARYVNSENKAFPSYETIAKKGSMAKVQAMRVVKSLIQKGLLKKEARKNKENEGSTSNLYTLLNPKPKNKNDNKKDKGVSDRYPGGKPQIPGVVSDRYPNNTNIKKTDLNNVNTASREEVVENSAEEIKEVTDEDINDIRKKIKKSLKEKEKPDFIKPQDFGRKKNNYQKDWNLKDNEPEENTGPKRRRREEDESLAKEISEVLEDDHSLGAFRVIVDKIPKQRIRILLSIIKDTYLTGRIKKSRGAMFISLAKDYAKENNIDLNFK
jgi:predicted transcriptional regulator